jgi:predicted MFS family arabinose efflux permease
VQNASLTAVGINPDAEVGHQGPRALGESTAPWTLYTRWQAWGFLAILFLVTTSNYFDYFVLSIVLDPIKREFRVSDTMLGLLSGFGFALCYALAALPIARWADRGNRRTIITIALTGWSAMTVMCGLAQSFGQLVLARIGVGLAEPGATPPAQSLVADYFPPERRAIALTIVTQWGAGAGGILGVGVGGYIAATYGWRASFLLAGVPGVVLAVIVWLGLREPRSQLGFPSSNSPVESLRHALGCLRAKRSFVLFLVGISVYALFTFSAAIFVPSFMIRSLHATLEQVSGSWGVGITIADLVGALVGGWLADYLSQSDIRWYGRLPAIACLFGGLAYGLAFCMHQLWTFLLMVSVAEAVLSGGVAVVFPAIHVVCGHGRRATAIAATYFSLTFFGAGFGPLFAGEISDAFESLYGLESLRYSLIAMLFFLVPAAVMFFLASRAIYRDREA